MMTRKEFLWSMAGTAGALGTSISLSGCKAQSLPLSTNSPTSQVPQKGLAPWGFATSLTEEYAYETKIEGRIPNGLRGTLYRNGSGLFERNGQRKRSILDGDGMIQAFRIHDQGIHFQNKFVQTTKFQEEQAAGEFLYATWTTQAPNGIFSNLFAQNMGNQAGVTVWARNGKLYAFDESSQPYELEPSTLETIGLSHLGLPATPAVYYAAHAKIDGQNQDWIHFGLEYGREIQVHFTIFNRHGELKKHWKIPLPRYVYLHDFFVSEKHIMLLLHPAEISIAGFLFGQRSFSESMQWKPKQGNMILVLNRDGSGKPLQIMTDASWMWHSLNAYERGNELIADFVGYDRPDHFLGKEALFSTMMRGKINQVKSPGMVRRYVINLQQKRIREEVISTHSHEFPILNPQHLCHRHQVGYFARSTNKEDVFHHSIVRIDLDSGQTESYDFGKGIYCGEPIFAPKENHRYEANAKTEPGWLLTECYNAHTQKSFLAILDAQHLADGPVAISHLKHHVPLSFHGHWVVQS